MLYLGMDEDRERTNVPAVDPNKSVDVIYFGQVISVDSCAKYMASDANGEVYCFSDEESPQASDEYEQWFAVVQCRVRYCGEVDLEGMDWRDTLREITTYERH